MDAVKLRLLEVNIYDKDDGELLASAIGVKIATEEQINKDKKKLEAYVDALLEIPDMDNITLAEKIEGWLSENGYLCPPVYVIEKDF